MTSACQASSCTGSGFARLDLTYDGEGHRTRIVETPASGAVRTTDLRYENGRVVGETEVENGVTRTRAFTLDEAGTIVKLTLTTSGGSTTYDGTYLVTYNGHGDALTLEKIETSGALTVANRFSYTTWGSPSVTTHNGHPDHRFRYRYVGRFGVADDGTALVPSGLLYMHARHYSAELGRFLQPDPARLETNMYGYAGNSPVTKVDSRGEVWWFVGIVVVVVRVASVVVRVVRAVPRLAPAAAAQWLRWRGYSWSSHLFKHGTSIVQVARVIMQGQKFRYFHEGQCKVGYFLASTGLFVAATIEKFIYTAFIPGNPANYIRSLKANPCP